MRRFHPERGPAGPRSFFCAAIPRQAQADPAEYGRPREFCPSRSPTPFRHAREGGHPERTRTTIAGKWKGQAPLLRHSPPLRPANGPTASSGTACWLSRLPCLGNLLARTHRLWPAGTAYWLSPSQAVMSGDEQSKGGPMGGFGGKDGAGARSAQRARLQKSLVDFCHDRTRGAIEGARIGG